MKDYIILMADIVRSRNQDQAALMRSFQALVMDANTAHNFVSPLTITLGDEFQGLLGTIAEAVQVLSWLEEERARKGMTFKLRYVIVEGLIETPVNPRIAYGMLGDGLTRARQYLEQLKKEDTRFLFWLKDTRQSKALNNVFIALQELLDHWNVERDHELIGAFLEHNNYIRVAMALKKERSLMWKRKKSLKINAYLALKETAKYIAHA
jgi:hypothetical protein